ncbi:MAG: hypothetical protein E7495_10180 [Ruminococcus flavefaciens]|jgi:hypothetical protein|nr:hypothetical protein [Ruminococcus flavefaciens]
MKKILAVMLAAVFALTGCTMSSSSENSEVITTTQSAIVSSQTDTTTANKGSVENYVEQLNFTSLDDPNLLRYFEDSVYSELVGELNSDDYFVENISTKYISKEYIEELQYNSQENIFFGYSLSELDKQFEGKRYVFSLGDDGKTTVKEFEEFSYGFDFDKVIKNVAIGSGVILVCVTVSVLTAGTAPAVSVVFAASASTATKFAISGTIISGASSAIVKGIQSGDLEAAMLSGISNGSEGFKWGAIVGAFSGGASKSLALYSESKIVPTPRESEIRALAKYGGEEQIAFWNGEEVAYNFTGATRPDVVVRNPNGTLEAIEVKNYDLKNDTYNLCRELKRQIGSRNTNLPEGSTQRIVLDVKGRGYSQSFINQKISEIQNYLSDTYVNIPIDVLT